MYLLMSSRQNLLHVDDVMFHEVFVEEMIDLQSGHEGSRGNIVIAVKNQGHLDLKMTDVALESFSLTVRRWLLFSLNL